MCLHVIRWLARVELDTTDRLTVSITGSLFCIFGYVWYGVTVSFTHFNS